jgi:membrane protease subunit HflK
MAEKPTTRDLGHEALSEALGVSFRLLRWVIVGLLILYIGSGVFIVGQHEMAFVLVFGKVAGLGAERIKGPGLHWTWPRPVAEVMKVPKLRVQAVSTSTAWYEQKEGLTNAPAPAVGPETPLKAGKDGYTLSGDANLVHSRWVLRYSIDDPEAYVFQFRDNDAVLLQELDHAVVKASARFAIDQALRTDIEAFRSAVANELARRNAELRLGIKLEGVEVVALAPPRQVAEAFNDVVAAEQERSERISAARGAAARALNEAQGQAARFIAEGQAWQRRVVSEVSADAEYFDKVYRQYAGNPDVIARTLRQDALRRALAGIEGKNIVSVADPSQLELRLQLSPERKSPWAAPEKK